MRSAPAPDLKVVGMPEQIQRGVLEPDSRRAIESVVGLRCNSSCRRLSHRDIFNALGVITAANVWRPLSETACPFLIGSR
jgi:hypothetical protein